MLRLFGVALLALPILSSIALAEDMKLPPLKKQHGCHGQHLQRADTKLKK